MRRASQSAGFTLMEVVVATSLMALVMTTLFMGLRLAANAWHKGELKLEEHARVLGASDLLARAVSGAVPLVLTKETREKQVRLIAFRGTPTEVRFVARRSWQAERSLPLFMIKLQVVRDAGDARRERLEITELPMRDDADVLAAIEENAFSPVRKQNEQSAAEILGEPAEKIEFEYLAPAAVDQPARWVSTWDSAAHEELPRAVRTQWTHGKEVQVTTFPIMLPKPLAGVRR